MERPDAPTDALRTLYAMGRKLRGEDAPSAEPDLYVRAATPVDPKPESAGVVGSKGPEMFPVGCDIPDGWVVTEEPMPIREAFTVALGNGESAEFKQCPDTGVWLRKEVSEDPIAAYHARTEAKAQRVADETDNGFPVNLIAEAARIRAEEDARGDRMAGYYARIRAKAHMAAGEGWGGAPSGLTLVGLRDTTGKYVLAKDANGSVYWAPLAEPAPTDDIPTLPANALRTWEG